jgi:hypothetical protein
MVCRAFVHFYSLSFSCFFDSLFTKTKPVIFFLGLQNFAVFRDVDFIMDAVFCGEFNFRDDLSLPLFLFNFRNFGTVKGVIKGEKGSIPFLTFFSKALLNAAAPCWQKRFN